MLNLRKIRQENGLAQKEVAAYLGVTQTAVSDWEREERQPDAETLVKLADFFNVSVDYLLGRDDKINTPQHVTDDETLEIMEILHKRPEMKILFNAGKKATKDDVLKAVAIVDALRKQAEGED